MVRVLQIFANPPQAWTFLGNPKGPQPGRAGSSDLLEAFLSWVSSEGTTQSDLFLADGPRQGSTAKAEDHRLQRIHHRNLVMGELALLGH